ncbi:MAG: hypothetical protein Tsb009_30430 [Planctomycetaceae bacterium]
MKSQTTKLPRSGRQSVDAPLVILAIAVVIGLLLVLFVQKQYVAARENQRLQQNRQRIAQMSERERERTRRKAKQYFEELNEDDRQAFREFHKNLQSADDSQELKETLNRFNKWLSSLTSFQLESLREKLRKAKSATDRRKIVEEAKRKTDFEKWVRELPRFDRERLERARRNPSEFQRLVAEIREEQQRRLVTGESSSATSFRRGMRSRGNLGPHLNSHDLDLVLKRMSSKLNYSASRKQSLQNQSPVLRHLQILTDAVRLETESPGKNFLKDSDLLPLLDRADIPSELKSRLNRIASSNSDPRRSEYDLLRLVVRSVMFEQFSRYQKPDNAELVRFSQQLSREDRQLVMKYRGEDQRRLLEYKYMQKQRYKSFNEFRTLFKLLAKIPGFPNPFRGIPRRHPRSGSGRGPRDRSKSVQSRSGRFGEKRKGKPFERTPQP